VIGRRRFLCGVGFGLIAAPIMIRAQQPPKVHRIGCLFPFRGTADVEAATIGAMVEGLRDLGWVEGRNLKIEYRSAENRLELYDKLARELVALNIDLIVAAGVNAVTAAKNATGSTPIVMVTAADPVKFGLVASLARPGGNVTGTALPPIDWGKWLELARESIPGASRVAVIGNPSNRVYADYVVQNEAAAKRLGLRLQMLPVARAEQFDEAFVAIKRERADALLFGPDALYISRMQEISDRASTSRLPLIGPNRRAAELGALIGYGYDFRSNWRRAAAYIDRILRGAKPSDLPVEQPNTFELVVNLKTAKALGIAIPQSVLLRADEVIK
jgi:putative tryptophan/tyrosine transport system substrate-binding protein